MPKMQRTPLWIGAVAVFLAVEPLRRLNVFFNGDWYAHLWPTTFMAHFFRAHGTIPTAISPEFSLLNPIPIFYGSLFFSVAGILASAVGSEIAYRLIFTALFALQFALVYLAARKYARDPMVGVVVGVLVTWGIYPLTN